MNIISRITHFIRATFLSGLLTALPIVLTVSFVHFVLRVTKSTFAPIHQALPSILHGIPYAELLCGLVIIFIIGLLVNIFLLDKLIHWAEQIVHRIPLIHSIYSGVKQIVHALIGHDLTFQQVVFVEFPRKGMYSVGFVTSKLPQEIAPTLLTECYVNVFIPTTPNPTTGFFVALPYTELIPVDITRQEAMALIISGGIIQPNRFAKKSQ